MLTDHQVRKLMKLLTAGEPLEVAAMRAGMDPKSARRYREAGRLPSEIGVPHTWRTSAAWTCVVYAHSCGGASTVCSTAPT